MRLGNGSLNSTVSFGAPKRRFVHSGTFLDLIGKRRRIRTVPLPIWAKVAVDRWTTAAGIRDGRSISRRG